MKKTNLRINNFFIFRKDKLFYLTDIDVHEEWIKSKDSDLEKFLKNNDCTEKINELKNLYDINSNVNFIIPDFKKFNVSLQKGGMKVIKFDDKSSSWQSGGAPKASPKSTVNQWGGAKVNQWGGAKVNQWGGAIKSSWDKKMD